MKKHIDLVIAGPEMSGTGTQVAGLIQFLKDQKKTVRDMRGTELDALFHAEVFAKLNKKYTHLSEFMSHPKTTDMDRTKFFQKVNEFLSLGGTNADLKIASCVQNKSSTYIDPGAADVWVFEEPTKRGAGQVNRTIEQHRSQYGSSIDPIAAAYCHQVYRIDEFLRFREPLRKAGKIIIRSRSEESACYQIRDKKALPHGIDEKTYLGLPGHKTAFAHPPTHIFIACGPANWTRKEYVALREARNYGRMLDDYELDTDYIILVNKRYATDWLENLYAKGCKLYGSKPPKIIRFDMLLPKAEVLSRMRAAFTKLMK